MCDLGHVLSSLCVNLFILNMGIVIGIHWVDLRIKWYNESEKTR